MNADDSTSSPHSLPEPSAPGTLASVGYGLAGIGALISIAALLTDAGRFSSAYLWGYVFLWSVVLGCLFFVGLQHLTHAVWSVALRRIAEMLASPMWLVGILFIPVLLFVFMHDKFELYSWVPPVEGHGHSVLHEKQAYLNSGFFTARAAVYFLVWIGFAFYFVRTSLKQDRGDAGPEDTLKMRVRSAPFMMLFAVTATFASIDWVMSLAPMWFSTMFGVYIFSGMVVTALSVIILVTIFLKNAGRLGDPNAGGFPVRSDHMYSLGTLLFAFVCFWGYIAFSQFMLIWYANMPEETVYFAKRFEGGWLYMSIALAFVRFGIPFLALLSRGAKTDPKRLVWVSVLMIIGQFLDLYWLIMPERQGATAMPGWIEIGPPLLMLGLLAILAARFLGRSAPLAVGDPHFEACRRFHL